MMNRKLYYERDALRGRFTRFLEVTLRHARQNYLREQRRRPKELPLEEAPESFLAVFPDPCPKASPSFDFDDERLADAFFQLPPMRQRILYLLFCETMKPAEIALHLHCSVQHVYNQRSLALKKLRQLLMEGGEEP